MEIREREMMARERQLGRCLVGKSSKEDTRAGIVEKMRDFPLEP